MTGQHMHDSGSRIGRGSLQNGAVIHHHHPADIQLPGIYRAADAASAVGQRIAFWLRGTQLLLLVAAATFAVIPITSRGLEWGALLAGIAFGAAFLIETTNLTIQPEKSWYQGRAVAESVKSLSWRYAAAGDPFARTDEASREADSRARKCHLKQSRNVPPLLPSTPGRGCCSTLRLDHPNRG